MMCQPYKIHHQARFRSGFLAELVATACLISLLAAGGCAASKPAGGGVRPPAAAGSFYPGESRDLARMVADELKNAQEPDLAGKPIGIIVPHAGYVFSGAIAALGLKACAGLAVDTVYVIGTSHYGGESGANAWLGQALRTPLGDYPIDEAAVKDLLGQCPEIHLAPAAWEQEHSVEVEVPFLQTLWPNAKIVPLIMGASSLEQCQAIATALALQAKNRHALLVASSDLSHYPTWENARLVDSAMLKAMAGLDPARVAALDQKFMGQGIPELACTACGLSAIETVMMASRLLGANRSQLLHYANSGDVAGDKSRVVGYAAMLFVQSEGEPALPALARPRGEPDALDASQQREVLARARAAIADALQHPGAEEVPPPGWMRTPRAVFVTLKQAGELRGCIGMTEARLPLADAVTQMACAAAFEDPRFRPLTSAELARTDIEISILAPLRRVKSADDIRMGTDGVVVRRDGQQGLFLPQVAQETGWSKDRFMDELCSQKAGLPASAWKDPGTELYVFTVQSFAEAPAAGAKP